MSKQVILNQGSLAFFGEFGLPDKMGEFFVLRTDELRRILSKEAHWEFRLGRRGHKDQLGVR